MNDAKSKDFVIKAKNFDMLSCRAKNVLYNIKNELRNTRKGGVLHAGDIDLVSYEGDMYLQYAERYGPDITLLTESEPN